MIHKTLYLIRGLPGAGKSTIGMFLVGSTICLHSADDYFMVPQAKGAPKYVFDAAKLPEAHKACLEAVKKNIIDGHPRIAVANTFTKRKHMQPYYDLADRNGYTVVEIIVKSNFKSIHNVPQEKIEQMRAEFEV